MLALGLACCGSCLGDSAIEVGGDTPYVRCLAAAPPPARTSRVGSLLIRLHGRELTIDGLPRPARLAAFSGPGLGAAPSAAAWRALRAAKPDLLLLVGDVGDTPTTAGATLAGLASLSVPTLVLAGGRDTRDRLAKAIRAIRVGRERIIDVTTLRAVRFSDDTLVPIAGAADGRYALEKQACGYGLADLKQVAADLADVPSARRWLLAWQAPASAGALGVARTERGVDLGSASLAELARRIAAPGGLFAWPHTQALRPTAAGGTQRLGTGVASHDLQIAVPQLSGAAIERDDGSRVASGFALLQLDGEGLRWLAEPYAPTIP